MEPSNWSALYSAVVVMRSRLLAPVDVTGCRDAITNKEDRQARRFHILIALILSARTRDQAVTMAMNSLRTATEGSLTPLSLASLPEERIKDLIGPAGVLFANNKARYVRETSRTIHENYGGMVPTDMKELLKLSGVGPKTATIFKQLGDQEVVGIAIDTHLQRMLQRWKWVHQGASVEETKRVIESWFPQELWKDVNQILVGFGQIICGHEPSCELCLVNKMCPSRDKSQVVTDIEDTYRAVALQRTKLVSEFGLPQKECEWTTVERESDDDYKIVSIKTKWLSRA